MSNKSVFKDQALKARSNRNAFSLAHTNVFHAPYGALLPVATFKLSAGSHFEMNMENQTIMQPIVKPAFTLLKEHFDVFAVPMVQLRQQFDNFITGECQYDSSAVAYPLSTNGQGLVPGDSPMFTGSMLADALYLAYTHKTDEFGLNWANGMCRILDLLGYGNYYKAAPLIDPGELETSGSAVANLISYTLPQNFYNLLAYQKIYYSAYCNKKYEQVRTYAFNIDDLGNGEFTSNDFGSSEANIDFGTMNRERFCEMARMHYRWSDKDYFTCVEPYVLPSSNYVGFSGLSASATKGNVWQLFGIPGTPGTTFSSMPSVVTPSLGNTNVIQASGESVQVGTSSTVAGLAGNLNISAIRFAFAYDKLLRRMRNAGPSFNLQMLAQFGIHPVDERHGEVIRLGGWTNQLRLSQVQSTADSGDADLGALGGNMTSYSNNTKKIKYTAKEDCIVMVIYSTSIKNQYTSFRYKRENLCRYRFDWFNPAFENLGLQPLFSGEYDYLGGQFIPGSTDTYYQRRTLSDQKAILGYCKRYLEYKTHPNEVHGLFQWQYNNNSMIPWVTQYRDMWVQSGDKQTIGQTAFAQPTLECSPFTLDGILASPQDGSWETDAFFVFAYFDAKVVANMSIDGEDF